MIILELIDRFTPIRVQFQNLRSLVDSFIFEISGLTILKDSLKIDYTVKKFKNQLHNYINQIGIEFNEYENGMCNIDFVKDLQTAQETITDLRNSIKSINEENIDLIKNNQNLTDTIKTLKNNLNLIKNENSKNECMILDLQEALNDVQTKLMGEKMLAEKSHLYHSDEINILKATLELKEKEIHSLTKDKKDFDKNLNKFDKDLLVSKALLRQCENEIKEYQIEIDRYKTLEKVDKKNMGHLKNDINEMKVESKQKENQLKSDYELISKLKDQIISLHNQITELSLQNEMISLELSKERHENKQNQEEIKIQQQTLDEQNDLLKQLSEKTVVNKKKKKKIQIEFNHVKSELTDVKTQFELNKCKLVSVETELNILKLNYGKLDKTLKENQDKTKCLNIMKTISDEKIKLLQEFIEDFRIQEAQLKNNILIENKENRSKINLMQQAFQKLF